MPTRTDPLSDADYAALAAFRYAIRRFQAFSEHAAAAAGLTPQQHQALLAIRACDAREATVGHVAERLIVKPHSATGVVDRLEALGLVERMPAMRDKRRTLLRLTPRAYAVLDSLSAPHRDEIRRIAPAMTEILAQLG